MGKLILVEDELALGSATSTDGALGGDGELSANHALLSCDHTGAWMVRDLGSATGTFLNGREVLAFEPLYRGDTLRLGESKLLVIEGPPRPPEASVFMPAPMDAPTISVRTI